MIKNENERDNIARKRDNYWNRCVFVSLSRKIILKIKLSTVNTRRILKRLFKKRLLRASCIIQTITKHTLVLNNRKSKLSDLIAARIKSPRAGQVSSRRGETCFARKTERTKKRLYRLQLFYKRGTRRTKFLVFNYFQIYSARLHGRRSMRAVA